MAHIVTWKTLSQEATQKCLGATDINDVRAVLTELKSSGKDDNSECYDFPFSHREHNKGQARILVDFYAHAILFARSQGMSAAKMSTVVGILHQLHHASMGERLTRPASYDVLRTLIVRHSVARPPYSAAVFDLDDVRALDEYVMNTYYRHYKMYYFAFVPKQTATIRSVPLGALTEVPPLDLPPLTSALTEAAWKQQVEQREQTEEEQRMEEALRESLAMEEERLRQADLNDPHYSDGIKEQLVAIRNAVMTKSTDRLGVLEERLTVIEAKVDEVHNKNRPASKSAQRKK